MNTEELADLLTIPNLPSYITQVEKELYVVAKSAEPSLGKPLLRVVRSGGKRLRPVLVIAAAGGRILEVNEDVISAAVAIELVHQASLVHDDIIDKAKLRRGVPTVRAQEGLDSAILVGDFLLSEGFRQAAAVSKEAAYTLAEAVSAMSEGQALEMTGQYQNDPSNSLYIDVAAKKAGALIGAAARMGGLCAGLRPKDIESLGKYGGSFGIAFQIIDDMLDGDLKSALIDKAIAEARHYCELSAKALGSFSDSSIAAGLAKLPGTYLENSLRKFKY